MNSNDFNFYCRQLSPIAFETILESKLNGNKFGCTYQSRAPANPEIIWNEFVKNHKQFFIEVPAEIIKDEIKQEIIMPPIEKVEGVVNSEI